MLKAADQFTVPSRRQFEKCKARATAASTAAAPNIKRIMRERSLIGFSYFVVGEFNSIWRPLSAILHHLITLSALTSTFGGIVRPICLAAA